jgi:zinc transport system permease protein
LSGFISALTSPDVPFLRYALIIGLIASVPFGMMGTFVVARRISYVAGAIAHCALGGVGAAVYFQQTQGWQHLTSLPLYGALVQALIAALIIGLVSQHGRQREDTVIGAVWSIGMAQGLIFMSQTPGYVDPMSYLFGRIVIVSRADVYTVTALACVVAVLTVLFYNKLVAVSFDEEFARLRGVSVDLYYLMLICLTAVTVVLLVTVVGIIMVIALLTIPAAVASQFARRIAPMMAVAVGACMLFTTSGLAVSYIYEAPSGPAVILIAGAVYLAVVTLSRLAEKRRKTSASNS